MKYKIPKATASQGFPPLDNNPNGPAGWDLIQLAYQENFAAMMQMLTMGDNTSVYIISGTLTISGGNYSWSGGWVWYAGDAGNSDGLKIGEIFYVPKVNSTTMGGNAYLNAAIDMTTPGVGISGSDPIIYIGGGSNSPHAFRVVKFTPAGAASVGAHALPAGSQAASLPYELITTLPDATLWKAMSPVLQDGAALLSANWAIPGVYSLKYWKDPLGLVHIEGFLQATGANIIALTMPVGYRPARRIFGVAAVTDTNTFPAGHCSYVIIDTTGAMTIDG